MFIILSAILASSPFVAPSDPILKTRAEELSKVEMTSDKTKALVAKMKEIANERLDSMAGLAAPQIGVAKRVILVNHKGNVKVYFNPQIVWKSRETNEGVEGCFSTNRVFGVVERPSKIKLCAYDEQGELLVETFEGFDARIFQHEVDHLNGTRFISHVNDLANLDWVEESEMDKYRKSYADWPHKCTKGQLDSLNVR